MRQNLARWRTIEARLGREMNVWLSTVRADGRPHMTPVWYVWLDDQIYFATGSDTQKFANLRQNQKVALALPDVDRVIILEGEAHVADHKMIDKLGDYFYHKYEWDFRYDDSADWRLVVITLSKILAWGDGHDQEGIRVR